MFMEMMINKVLKNIGFVLIFVLIFQSTQAQSYLRYKVVNGDTVAVCDLSVVTVGGRDYSKPPKFKNKRESYKYKKMTRYVKKDIHTLNSLPEN